jgi:hypothetical protein
MVMAHEQPRTEPFALAFSPSGRLFVSDHFHECVQVFDRELKHLGSLRPKDGEFLPMGLAFLPDGQLAVVNYKQQSVLVFDVGESFGPSEKSHSGRSERLNQQHRRDARSRSGWQVPDGGSRTETCKLSTNLLYARGECINTL